jgi:hypothetical protein
MKSRTSGWSTFRITILAARRVLPPDLITPAKASKPRMNETGPDAVPPPLSSSREDRIDGEVAARARAALEEHGLGLGEVHDRFHRVLDRVDEARRALRVPSTPTLNQTGLLKAIFWWTSR